MISKLASTVVAIPARGGSKRIPCKNLQYVGNLPLIAYTINTALNLGIAGIYVTTDSEDIAQISQNLGASIINRPPELASDTATDLDWLKHLIREIWKMNGIYPENIVLLRPTSPLRCVWTVNEALSVFNEENSSLRSVEPISEALEKHFRIKDNLLQPCFPMSLDDTNLPNQVFPMAYKANGYIDIIKTKTILEYNSVFGNAIQSYITPHIDEIDTQDDLDYVRYIVETKNVR
jgi:CMP-N-acetylneuraminic acid synthetase